MPSPEQLSSRQALWPVAEAGLAAVLSAISAFLLARLVGPAEVGIGAAAVAVHVLLWVGVNALFADALTQSRSTDPRELSSAIWAATLAGCLAALLQAAAGLFLALALDDARLLPMSLALALPLPFVGAAGAMQGLLTRARRYDVLAGRAIAGQGIGTLLGVGAALAGAGAWALVAQQCATSLLGALFLLARAGWAPIPAWRGAAVRNLLRLGAPVAVSAMVQQGRYRLFLLLLGGMLGPAALGQVHLAFRLVDTVKDLAATVLWRILLPGFSERVADPAQLRAGVEQALNAYAPVLFPLCAAMLLAVEPLTRILLGPAWAPSGEAAIPLILLMAWLLLGAAAGVAVVARGQGRLVLCNSLAGTGLVLAGTLLVQPQSALEAVVTWCTAHLLIAPWIAWRNAQALEVPVTRLYRAGLPALTASAFALLVGYFLPLALEEPEDPLLLIVLRLAIAAMAYLPYAMVFLRADLLAGWRASTSRVAGGTAALLLLLPLTARAQTVLDNVPHTIPGYDARFGTPILARAQSRLRDLGLAAGPVTVTPALDAGMGYDSAALASTKSTGSFFGSTRASLLATAEPGDARLVAYGSADNRSYITASNQNRTNAAAALGAAIPLGGGTLSLAGSYLYQHQDRSDVEARPSDKPIGWQAADIRALYSYRFNRLTVAPNIEFTAYRFANTTVFGIPSNQSFRDRDVIAGGIGARYDMPGGYGLVAAARGMQTRYIHPGAGAERDSTGLALLAGIASGPEGVWRYSLLLGAEGRRFAAAPSASPSGPRQSARVTPVADLQLQWLPSGMTAVNLRLTRAMEESAWLTAPGSTVTRFGVSVEHEYLRDVIFGAHAGVQVAEFPDSGGRTRVSGNVGARVTWVVDRNVQLSLSYDLARWTEGILVSAPQETTRLRNLALVSIRLVP